MSYWIRKKDPPLFETIELVVSGIIPIIIIAVGTIGNLICMVILMKKENRRMSTNVYLIFLCLMDTVSLYQYSLRHMMYTFTNGTRDVWGRSMFLCKTGQFLAFYTLHTSAMCLSFVQIDRACLLFSKLYKRKIARPYIALIICGIMFTILFAMDGFLLALGYEYSTYNSVTGTQDIRLTCSYSADQQLNNFFNVQYAWIHLVIMYVLPFSIILVCTIMIVRKLMTKQTFINQQLAINAQRNRRISLMLLLMCATYIITTLPNRLCFSVFQSQLLGHDYTDTVFLSSNTLMYTRNALNIVFLYISVYGFRRDLQNLLLLICFRKRPTQVVPFAESAEIRVNTIETK